MPEITTITSESLQATIRRLLPSQRGFGTDLEASNVITPIIDLTPTAEGSQLPLELSQASALGSTTAFSVQSATITTANTVGFYLFEGVSFMESVTTGVRTNFMLITDGLSSANVFQHAVHGTSSRQPSTSTFKFVVFLDTGQSVSVTGSSAGSLAGNYRVIADRYGNITNPAGFTFE